MVVELNAYQRHLLVVCVDRYVADIRTACSEDQGIARGEPGTLGHTMQRELTDLREAFA
jgi:hypothetical protein